MTVSTRRWLAFITAHASTNAAMGATNQTEPGILRMTNTDRRAAWRLPCRDRTQINQPVLTEEGKRLLERVMNDVQLIEDTLQGIEDAKVVASLGGKT